MLQAMWPLVALKFRQQPGRDDGEGRGREAASQRGTGSSTSCLGLAHPSAGAQPQGGGSPPARSQRWSCGGDGEWSRLRGVMGVGSCIPSWSCLPVATATREQEHLSTEFYQEREEVGCASGRGEGDPRAARPQGSGGVCPSSPRLHREPFHQYSHHGPSLGSRPMLG